MNLALKRLVQQVRDAKNPLRIRGGGSKDFYGEAVQGELLDTRPLSGITSYEPSELVVTVLAGTPLVQLEERLAEQGQCLAFEPPRFNTHTTVGGMLAAGLAGPSRAAVGGARDYMLGVTMINGRGELLSFGGQVMKNVAGYDVSRLMVGSLGVLGVIVEASLKVMPIPPARATLEFQLDEATALHSLNSWAGQALALNASAWRDGRLYVRLSGAHAAVEASAHRLGGDRVEPATADSLWLGLRDHTGTFHGHLAQRGLERGMACWRLSLPSTAAPLDLPGDMLIEHGGAQRWLVSDLPAAEVRAAASRVGGQATRFRAADRSPGVFQPLPAPLDRLHRNLKQAFDPRGIFNPGRMYPGL